VVAVLRRGRCLGCYRDWQEAQPVGLGASCVVCGDRRKDDLQRVELHGRWLPFCHVCAAKTRRLDPLPPSVEGIRQRLQRERRYGDRRREAPDARLFREERRGDERRALLVEDADILWMDDLPLIELTDVRGPVQGDPTVLYERVDPASLVEDVQARDFPI
jgi:hypothetical protein